MVSPTTIGDIAKSVLVLVQFEHKMISWKSLRKPQRTMDVLRRLNQDEVVPAHPSLLHPAKDIGPSMWRCGITCDNYKYSVQNFDLDIVLINGRKIESIVATSYSVSFFYRQIAFKDPQQQMQVWLRDKIGSNPLTS
jgi:hypothetical protein